MSRRAVAVIITTCLSLSYFPVAAQAQELQVRSVNPEAIEFDPPPANQPTPTEYRVDFFKAGSDTLHDVPVKSIEVGKGAQRDNGTFRVDLTTILTDVPDGQYVATMRATAPGGPSVQSEPSQLFVLSRGGTPEERQALERRERLLSKVGFAILGGILLVPYLIK